MPFKTVWEDNEVYQAFEGIPTQLERKKADNEVLQSPQFDTIKYWIVDDTGITEYNINKSQTIDAAAFNIGASKTNKNIYKLFITKNPKIIKNITIYSNLFEETKSPWVVKTFNNLKDARDFIYNNI